MRPLLSALFIVAALTPLSSVQVGCSSSGPQTPSPQELAARAAKIRSYRAQVVSQVEMGGQELRQSGTIQKRGPDEMRLEMRDSDGELIRVLVQRGSVLMHHAPHQKRVVKLDTAKVEAAIGRRPPGTQGTDPSRPFDGMVLDGVRYVETTKLDGNPVHLFEGTLEEAEALAPRLGFRPEIARVWVDQRTGLMRRSEIASADGSSRLSQSFREIEIDAEIDPESFYLKPPAGVSVVDMTDATIKALSGQPLPKAP